METDPKLVEFVRRTLEKAETRPGEKYRPSFSTGKSGLSFGGMQNDVRTNPGARKALRDMLDMAKARGEVDDAFIDEVNNRVDYDSAQWKADPLPDDGMDKLDTVLDHGDSRKAIDELDQEQAQPVADKVDKAMRAVQQPGVQGGVLDPVNPDPESVAIAAAWANRTGGLNEMQKHLEGLKRPATWEDIEDYLSDQKQFKSRLAGGNGEDYLGWRQRVIEAARENAKRLSGKMEKGEAGTGGEVEVDAHLREGYPVRAYTRSRPGEGVP